MPATIMVVEDDEELNEILTYNLTKAGYKVVQAFDGREALRLIESQPPDLLLLDLMLPGADGWEICETLSDNPKLKEIPIVIHSAKGAREDFDRARQFDLAGYFTKPYMTADVLRHVEKVLNQRLGSGGTRAA